MQRAEATTLERLEQLEQLAAAADRARPTALAREHVLAVAEPLRPLVPGGLARGTSVQVAGRVRGVGSTSLALALLAGPSGGGSWVAAVGVPTLGLAAAAGFGVDLGRLVLVAPPPAREWGTVVATLLDAFDVVLARPPLDGRVGGGDARRLAARARERGSVLVRLAGEERWPEAADLSLAVTATTWEGLGRGHGHLRARRAVVESAGRRGHARLRRAELWLPGPGGTLAAAPPLAEVRRLTRTEPPPTRPAHPAARGAGPGAAAAASVGAGRPVGRGAGAGAAAGRPVVAVGGERQGRRRLAPAGTDPARGWLEPPAGGRGGRRSRPAPEPAPDRPADVAS